jgi:predicted amidohydrolase YtcJ
VLRTGFWTLPAVLVCALLAMAQQQRAQLVVLNGKVVTVDSAFTIAEAIAIRDGRFVAIGKSADVRALAGPDTRVIDARGRMVIPGLIDTHVHATMVAAAEAVQPFQNLESIAAIQEWVRTAARNAAAGTWLWSPRLFPTRLKERRLPTRAELDAAAPTHPVAIDGAYAVMLNTAALRAGRITHETPDPAGGAIVRGADGEPTGLLRNVGGMLARFQRQDDQRAPLDQLERVHRQYLAAGITSIIERGANVGGYRAYEALKRENRLRVRSTVTIRLPASSADESSRFIESLPFGFGAGDEWLKVGPLKIVADGGILAGTSFMREPYGLRSKTLYGVDDPAYRGFLTLTPTQINSAFALGHARGWQMVAHVTGDAGVDAVLDAIEAAHKQDGNTSRRHTLIHAYFPNAETARRAARLNVLVDTQPAWYYKDADALVDALGEARLAPFIGLRTWLDAGVRTALNTDHMFGLDGNTAMNPFNPFLTMYVATTRRTESGRVIGASEAVTREEALRMMTRDAAFFSFDEGTRGSIEVGKLGDLAILSDDLLTCPADRIRDIKADATVVAGKVVYER